MANLIGTPTYVNILRQLETVDPAHPNTWNPNYQALLNNTAFLKQLAESIATTLTNHMDNKNNPHGVTASQIGAALAAHTHDANDLPKASTSGQGIVQLTDSVSSTSTTLGATASAIKAVMDRANEAFTQAGEGKSSIATAVMEKGVSASPADTFATLADKIGQISTGVKLASGANPNTYFDNEMGWVVEVDGLDFTPTYVVLAEPTVSSQYSTLCYSKYLWSTVSGAIKWMNDGFIARAPSYGTDYRYGTFWWIAF